MLADFANNNRTMCEVAATDDIVVALCGHDEPSFEDEPGKAGESAAGVLCKDALNHCNKLSLLYCAQKNLSEQVLKCLSVFEDNIRSVVKLQCLTKNNVVHSFTMML